SLHVCVCHAPDTSSPDAPSYQRIRFQIEDTGIGISPEHLETIFRPFEHGQDHHRYSAGPGLGLAISQRLVRMMGSELQVTSQVGQGSTFWFDVKLPIADEQPAHEPQAVPVASAADPHALPPTAMTPPPRELIVQLYNLAIIGDIIELRKHLQNLQPIDDAYAPFFTHIRRLAQDLKIAEIQKLLTPYIQGDA
ncbi:hypothetical protein GF339_13435, partial [candidate division KSB3 bacterium]|nr:hypothetical protein [candidate division KSB3 bacterium]MBD3325581.1 hypothetical protein [candidate division KSB3 bacterium]